MWPINITQVMYKLFCFSVLFSMNSHHTCYVLISSIKFIFLRRRQWQMADIFQLLFSNYFECCGIVIQRSLIFSNSPIDNNPTLANIKALCKRGDKELSEIMMTLPSYKCIARHWLQTLHHSCHKCVFAINSLWPSDTIWRQRSGSTLAQVMACCLKAPSHYLTQCWLIIIEVQWHS